MANTKAARKPREKSPEEVKLAAFLDKLGDKEPTAAQVKELNDLEQNVRAAKFKKGAELHGLRILNSLDKLTGLANPRKFHYTEKQVESLRTAFNDKLTALFATFAGKKAAGAKLDLS